MKKFIQLFIFCLIIIALILFKKEFLFEKSKNTKENNLGINQPPNISDENLIKNLKYEVTLRDNDYYIITSSLSELIETDESDQIKMFVVEANYIDKKKIPLTIRSGKAYYNNINHNTLFEDNVSIEYLSNKIFSDKVELNFLNNAVKIYQNVKFKGDLGSFETDNITINLITKKINIYMNDKDKKVSSEINY